MAGENPLANPMGHTIDSDSIHLPGERHFDIYEWSHNFMGDSLAWAGIHGMTKFMFLELIATVIMLLLLIPMAARLRRLGYAKGMLSNSIEAICMYIRDNVAVPALGEKDANRYLPFLWSVFFFILINNLLGLIPWLGSPTGALGCTTALALCSLVLIHGSGIFRFGPFGYLKSLFPHVPLPVYILMVPIELLGHVVKPAVLAFRLFVNMTAGHTLLFVVLAFIAATGGSIFYWLVMPMSIVGVVLFSLLEILVAFLQAYVFTFLSAIFIGVALHPQH